MNFRYFVFFLILLYITRFDMDSRSKGGAKSYKYQFWKLCTHAPRRACQCFPKCHEQLLHVDWCPSQRIISVSQESQPKNRRTLKDDTCPDPGGIPLMPGFSGAPVGTVLNTCLAASLARLRRSLRVFGQWEFFKAPGDPPPWLCLWTELLGPRRKIPFG